MNPSALFHVVLAAFQHNEVADGSTHHTRLVKSHVTDAGW